MEATLVRAFARVYPNLMFVAASGAALAPDPHADGDRALLDPAGSEIVLPNAMTRSIAGTRLFPCEGRWRNCSCRSRKEALRWTENRSALRGNRIGSAAAESCS